MSIGIVGPIAGSLAALPAATGATTFDNAEGLYTVAIGGLPFNIAPTDENPYQRATAQFRKQQFDSAPTPGDQSLDGLWLRGQFSFHRGAGVKFFEALDQDATDSRFQESSQIDPWTPGQASLSPAMTELTPTAIVDMAAGDGASYALSALNIAYKVTSSSVTALTSGAATSIAANDLGEAFVTAAAKIQRLTSGTTFSDLITQSDGHTFVKVAWAKSRLFMVDTTGRWYTKPDASGTVAEADAFWNSGVTSAVGDWSVAESPSAVYLGRGSSIYAVIPDTDGTVPTLDAPVVAATLPPGETVQALGFSLGWLVVVTNAGVRVAQSSTSGALELGPTLIDFSFSSCNTIGFWRNLAYLSGEGLDDTSESLYVLDLSQVLDQDVVAYTRRLSFTSNNTGSGAVVLDGSLVVYGDFGIQIEGTDSASTGYLTTGFIRFGTMEPKAFTSLRVKLDGTEGSLLVSTVELSGEETLITSIPASRFADQEVSLNLPAPLETIGFKFTFNAGAGGTGPTLLGYQLRALPAPARRTRMISLPLECYDDETHFNGLRKSGGPGWAYARLAALEAMEQDSGVVLFQDFRTGEQANCFIEEIAFTNRTAPVSGRYNFGGTLNVTLRKVP